MGKKILFLEVVERIGKPPIVYIWTHHGKGYEGEWRGSILEPRKHSILRWLRDLFADHYDRHSRAYTRARMRGERAVKHGSRAAAIHREVLLKREENYEHHKDRFDDDD